jgi:hypothetical protein
MTLRLLLLQLLMLVLMLLLTAQATQDSVVLRECLQCLMQQRCA